MTPRERPCRTTWSSEPDWRNGHSKRRRTTTSSRNYRRLLMALTLWSIGSIGFLWRSPLYPRRVISTGQICGLYKGPIILSHASTGRAVSLSPQSGKAEHKDPYFGISFERLSGDSFQRETRANDASQYQSVKRRQLVQMDKDAVEVSSRFPEKYDHFEERTYPPRDRCYRMKWTFEYFPSCNSFHEVSLERPFGTMTEQNLNITSLSEGYYRSTWLLADALLQDAGVLKQTRLKERRHYNGETFGMVQAEALTMLSTVASNRTMDIYGHCGGSVLVERGRPSVYQIHPGPTFVDQAWLDKQQVDDVVPLNKLNRRERLDVALAMAESLAEMHGHYRGVIVNNDLAADQWLWDSKGRLKLNDFNNAVPLEWDPKDQSYCKLNVHYNAMNQAPEMHDGRMSDEAADVASWGKVAYTVLTGLRPYYQKGSRSRAIQAIKRGELPYIDPRYRTRSFIEGRMASIIGKAFAFQPEQRPTIFEIVEFLRETKELYAKKDQNVNIA